MTQRFTGFLSAQEAQAQANHIVVPFIGQLTADEADTLVQRIAANLRHASYEAYQRGLDHITLGGEQHQISKED